tara:strand:+ start:1368 stop:2261 length:894 start_codon:yes stop_codon:yes gene_type:complete
MGLHHKILKEKNWNVDFIKGPLTADQLLPIIDQYNGIICGDDEYNKDVLKKGFNNKLIGLSKYGVGLDKIDLDYANKIGLKVKNCPGINKSTVAEHVFALLLSYKKNIHREFLKTSKGKWPRYLGSEISNSNFGIVGLGNIGKEVAKIASAFNCKILCFDKNFDKAFVKKFKIQCFYKIEDFFTKCDIVSLHLNLNQLTRRIISYDILKNCAKKNLILINTARGELVDEEGLYDCITEKKIQAYLCDVLSVEPLSKKNKLYKLKNVIITSHIGSKTYQNIENQGIMAVENLNAIFND